MAGHERLATTVLADHGTLGACADLIRTAILNPETQDCKATINRDGWLAASLLALRIPNDAGACSVLIDRGYFLQAAALMRTIAETAQLLIVFADDPSRIEEWHALRGKERYGKYGHSKMLAKLESRNLFTKFQWFEGYFDTFSEFGGHPSAVSILAYHDGSQLHVGPHFNQSLFTKTYRDLATLVWHATDVCGDLWEATMTVPLEDLLPEKRQLFLNAWTAIAPAKSPAPTGR